MGILGIIGIVSAIMQALPGLIQAAESIFGAVKGRGAVKKEFVQQSVAAALSVAAATGNDDAAKPEVQQAIIAASGTVIDGLVSAINAAKAWGQPQSGPDV